MHSKQTNRLRIILLCLILFCFGEVAAQTTISGSITDKTGQPIPGVNVTLKDTYDGVTTGSEGAYQLITEETGEQVLVFSFVGYRNEERSVVLQGDSVVLSVDLKDNITSLNDVVITAGSFEASDSKVGTTLNFLDVVTTANANADIVAALGTLPGTQQVGESEGLFVRGGDASETQIFIDGMLVDNFFYSSLPNIAQRGRFNPALFQGTVFSSGGYSALYGQGLSGALILESIDIPEKSETVASISTVDVGVGMQSVLKSEKLSVGFNYSYANLSPYYQLIEQKPEYYKAPEAHIGDVNLRAKLGKGILKLYGYLAGNRLSLGTQNIDSLELTDAFTLDNINSFSTLTYTADFNDKWNAYFGASYSYNSDDVDGRLYNRQGEIDVIKGEPFGASSFTSRSTENLTQTKVYVNRSFSNGSNLKLGGEYLYSVDENDFDPITDSTFSIQVIDHYKAAFTEANLYLSRRFVTRLGLRMEHSTLLQGDQFNIAPRFSLGYELNERAQLSLAYGRYFQRPDEDLLFTNRQNGTTYANSTHYVLNLQNTGNARKMRFEAFYKDYNKLFTFTGAPNALGVLSNDGDGRAAGFELFWRDRKSVKNFDYWLSYSYLSAERRFNNFPTQVQPSFSADHTLSLVTKYLIPEAKIQLNMAYRFSSGRPYYNLQYDARDNSYFIAQQGNTINFNDLSLSLTYIPSLNKPDAKVFSVLVLSLSNVLGSDQEFDFRFSQDGTRRQAVGLPATRLLFLGYFINIGVDKTQTIIDNML